ncbi:inorganic pyrophosphatase protein [Halorhabdus tiamatea SARL4B]|uniref:Inorganic pyrophosphatase protein n=1 Tax=Halorhabdus tiamatea SARL4B TaxID=1033806 RepID=F7PQC5_9EURY|nr:bifunctional oligoribonuclease/PAP phosphatase NrnA [Halorhabdus tiamatea]ERJ06117.1 inorganic pyrophosphatase protein [Halorhabdus tiamatea SARL4B]CCQ33255.1 phosphoesterase RecJ domain protein [Halorhabdus tiamatea SARL4B]
MVRPGQADAAEAATAGIDAVTDFAASNPIVAGVAVVVGLVLVVGLAVLIRRHTRMPGQRLRRVLADHDRVSVLMHPNPDPDAMGAAQGVAELASSVDTEAVLQHPGQIRHQQNRAFETVLDLDLDQIETAEEIDADAVVLVDHNEARGFPGADALSPVAVIDHHPGDGTGSAFADVRSEYGACATILAEYFEYLGVEPGDPDAEGSANALPSEVATGLLYGIQADTKHLTKGCSPAEFDAASYLYEGIDEATLDRIANPEVDTEVLEVKARAITERDVRGAFACSDVGTVSNVDAIPQAADELLRLEGVTAIVVLGVADGTVHLSGRSRDDRVHMGRALQAAVEDIPMAEAGGHARMGGGQISVEHMNGLGPGEGVSRTDLRERLFEAMTGDRQ